MYTTEQIVQFTHELNGLLEACENAPNFYYTLEDTIYLVIPGYEIYCTPGWEMSTNTLPVEIVKTTGHILVDYASVPYTLFSAKAHVQAIFYACSQLKEGIFTSEEIQEIQKHAKKLLASISKGFPF